ncbi:acetate/propionate family kinase [Aestuariicella hydrocarbonica]|uniref:Acetate kinase n=1 Tax=Pseudomaricurvus hydrocarbonicus TaxID=1470433 RepID=A0A9E5JW69_9GAMM|nr:acetate/propionate family kinase [Aestuariicella hydrocarbonica]NHO65696.1 acetate/propionate family kinase [Aestuariicella hydrocarbonica]
MPSLILTLNAGSSSVKFALFTCGPEPDLVASGKVEQLGHDAQLLARWANEQVIDDCRMTLHSGQFHAVAFDAVFDLIRRCLPDAHIVAVGHRVVHGGIDYTHPTLIDAQVLADLENLTPFAPLHEPHNIRGIRAAGMSYKAVPQIACFDTSFHRQHPFVNDVFALPRRYYEQGVRRYGFHGLSYEYIANALAQTLPEVSSGSVIVAHLGNGASMCGLKGGQSIASTMGFSALDGLPMGTRCGEIDPGVILYMLDNEGLSSGQISNILYKESGLLGISGLSNDMRTLISSNSPAARQAVDYFVYRVRCELGGLAVALGGLDALVFTGGIGEHQALVRERICAQLEWLGVIIDGSLNVKHAFDISAETSPVRVLVIPTNEELVIARAVAKHLSG